MSAATFPAKTRPFPTEPRPDVEAFEGPAAALASAHRLARLESLLDLDVAALEALYLGARVPRIGDVAGDLHGRMLAWPMLTKRPTIARLIRGFAGSGPTFPWRGKSFAPMTELHGEGINRVFRDRFRLFKFVTFVSRSKAGDFDALQLDYDLPGNPPVIRSIKDEIREIEPGVWLGQAYLQTRSKHHLWLYFALAQP